jgi:serine protease
MRRILIGTVALAATLLSPLATQAPFAQGTTAVVAASGNARVIVKYRADSALLKKQAMTAAGTRILQAQALGERIGIALTPGIGITDRSHVVFARGIDSKALAKRLAAESDIEYAVPDQRKHIVAVPSDSYYRSGPTVVGTSGGPAVGQWYLKPPGAAGTNANTAPSAINAEQAWDVTLGSANVIVADLDTGVRFDHPDLQGGNVLQGYDMITKDSDGTYTTANDASGPHAGASDPGDWVDSTSAADPSSPLYQCTVEDSSWHGTQTLGLIGAATDNGIGIASVGRRVKLLPVRVLGRCGGFDSDIEAGMLWAVGLPVPNFPTNANPARVLNMSLGGSGSCPADYVDTVNQVLATGASIIVAAALRSVGDKVGFSDLGSEVSISSPGGNCVNTASNLPCLYPIMTTANSGTTTPVVGAAGGIYTDAFNTSLGTSFSTPLVTGTVALMLSVQPTLTPTLVKQYLQQTARPFPTTGGNVSIDVTTPTPTAESPVALTAAQPPQCAIPTSTNPNQGECLCTTSSCGAGMLDAHAAVTLASGGGLIPPTSVVTTNSYQWTLVDGGGIVTSLSGATTQNASATPTGAGTFTVSLTTTDSAGVVMTTTSTVTVAAAPITPPSSGGGGGALTPYALLFLLAAVLALAVESRLRKRRQARISDPRPPSSRRR